MHTGKKQNEIRDKYPFPVPSPANLIDLLMGTWGGCYTPGASSRANVVHLGYSELVKEDTVMGEEQTGLLLALHDQGCSCLVFFFF